MANVNSQQLNVDKQRDKWGRTFLTKDKRGRTFFVNFQTNGDVHFLSTFCLADYTTKTEYDYAGRPTKQYRADGSFTTTVYDKVGNAVSATDYMGNTTTYAYDKLGRQISVTAPFEGSYTATALTYYDKNCKKIRRILLGWVLEFTHCWDIKSFSGALEGV